VHLHIYPSTKLASSADPISDAEYDRDGTRWSKASSPNQSEMTPEEKAERQKTWRKLILMIWRELANHRYASVFAHPIRHQHVPNYYKVVKCPMDLNTVRKRVREGVSTHALTNTLQTHSLNDPFQVINTTDEFHRDMLLIFQNAAMFNPAGSEFYQMALEMMEEVDRAINAFRQTESTSWQGGTQRRRRQSIMTAESPRPGTN
jgi:bromodomain-containing protein 8